MTDRLERILEKTGKFVNKHFPENALIECAAVIMAVHVTLLTEGVPIKEAYKDIKGMYKDTILTLTPGICDVYYGIKYKLFKK